MLAHPTVIDLGGCRVTLISGGGLRLDGGAMFGIIPKVLWARRAPPDDDNRIQLACNCLLVEWDGAGARRAIVETGHGEKYGEKERRIFAIDVAHWLLPSLLSAGVEPDSVDDVFVTHLHFDHAGGLTRAGESGALPTFPRARVHVQRREFEDARANFGVMTQTYREENFAPLDAAGAWVLHDGEARPLPGVRLIPSPGHTRGHQSVLIEGRERSLLFGGDVMPTRNHLGRAYNMAYDVLPLDNMDTKRRLLQDAARHGWLWVIDHEPLSPLAEVRADGDAFSLV